MAHQTLEIIQPRHTLSRLELTVCRRKLQRDKVLIDPLTQRGYKKKFLDIYKVVSYYTYLFLDYFHSPKPDGLQKVSHNTIMYAYITGVCGLLIIMYTIALFQKIYNKTYQAV